MHIPACRPILSQAHRGRGWRPPDHSPGEPGEGRAAAPPSIGRISNPGRAGSPPGPAGVDHRGAVPPRDDAPLVPERDVTVRKLPYRCAISRIADAAVHGYGEHLLDGGLQLVPELHLERKVFAFLGRWRGMRRGPAVVLRLSARRKSIEAASIGRALVHLPLSRAQYCGTGRETLPAAPSP